MDLRRLLFDNWGIKLLSMGLALTLWLYVTSKGKTEMALTIPLELRNIPRDMAVVGDVVGSLEVRVQGQERVLRDITTGKKVVGVVDLSVTGVGENTVRISPDDIRRPAGLAITYISPSEVKVQLEPLVQKTFRVRPVIHGTPAKGYRLANIFASPSKISVEGPASVIKSLTSLQTMPIDIQGAEESVTVEPRIDYQGTSLKILNTSITVRVNIERVNR